MLAAFGIIRREGTCQPCMSCGDGFMTVDCVTNYAGRCQQCRTVCAVNQYWAHASEFGCWPQLAVNGARTYMPAQDYECRTCLVYRQRVESRTIVELFVGCSGRASVERWHVHADVRFNSTGAPDLTNLATLQSVVQKMVCNYDDSKACYYNGQRFRRALHAFDYIYPKKSDLYLQQYTQIIPYCPPGWFVDIALLDPQNSQYRADACKKCSICDYGRGQKRTSTWKRCDGYGTTDTQTCTDNSVCAIGQYLDTNDTQCKQCTQCT